MLEILELVHFPDTAHIAPVFIASSDQREERSFSPWANEKGELWETYPLRGWGALVREINLWTKAFIGVQHVI